VSEKDSNLISSEEIIKSSQEEINSVIFKEQQRFSNWILWLMIISLAVAVWFWFVATVILSTSSASGLEESITPVWFVVLVWVIAGIVIPVFVFLLRFDLQIENGEIKFQYFPFHLKPKRLSIKEIKNYKIVRYDPLGDYGGWGVQKKKNTIGYITPSNRGVIVLVENEMQLTFGTDQPKELYLAIDKVHKLMYPGKVSVAKNASISNVKKNLSDKIDGIGKKKPN
jgi:hypothetical protein